MLTTAGLMRSATSAKLTVPAGAAAASFAGARTGAGADADADAGFGERAAPASTPGPPDTAMPSRKATTATSATIRPTYLRMSPLAGVHSLAKRRLVEDR